MAKPLSHLLAVSTCLALLAACGVEIRNRDGQAGDSTDTAGPGGASGGSAGTTTGGQGGNGSGGSAGQGGAATGGQSSSASGGSTGQGGVAAGGSAGMPTGGQGGKGSGGSTGQGGGAGGKPSVGDGGGDEIPDGGGSEASTGMFPLPDLPAMPTVPTAKTPNSVPMGNPANFAEVKMDFPIRTGPVQPTWQSIADNSPADPAWLRKAKFGIWVHFGPQAAGRSGDWYARHMYQQSYAAYTNHLAGFGHPSTSGYKDFVAAWNPSKYDPAALAQTFYDAGARFVLVQGVHHDEFDNWDSRYNPFNAKNFALHSDFVGAWSTAARSVGLKVGIAFHHEYSWWWGQTAYGSDTSGALAGVPYDAAAIATSGNWIWQNYDLHFLYNINLREYQGVDALVWNLPQGIFSNHLDYAHWYATWWALRIMDVIEKYDPDFIYTDGNSTQPFSGYLSGTGYKCDAMQRVIAHYFNRALERRGSVNTSAIVKFHPGDRIINTFEANYPSDIKTDQPWIAETPVGDWYYASGFTYDSGMVIRELLEAVSRDGGAAIAISPMPDGSLDDGTKNMLAGIGQWMNKNGAGIYGSKAWMKYGEGSRTLPTGTLGASQANYSFTTSDFRFTVDEEGYLYAYCMTVPTGGTVLRVLSLGSGSGLLAKPITSVELLGYAGTVSWTQAADSLQITIPSDMGAFKTAIGFKIGPAQLVPLSSPSGLVAKTAAGQVSLSWNSISSTATYTVKRGTSASGPFDDLASGLVAGTYVDTTAAADTLYYYTVSATEGADTSPNAVPVSAAAATSSSGAWLTQDIGSVAAAGSFTVSNDTLTVKGSGADIWGSSDEFRYVFAALTGNFTLSARVVSMTNTAKWAKVGLMIRETLTPSSKYVIHDMSPANGAAFESRATTGGSSANIAVASASRVPTWLRLVRNGNTFTSYVSSDGTSWTSAGSTTVSMSDGVYAGLEVCSVADGTLCQGVFDNVSIVAN
jgi:alpha-L-fucosidase